MEDLRQQIESDLEKVIECLTDKTYNAIHDALFYYDDNTLLDFTAYAKEKDETITYSTILKSFMILFTEFELTPKDVHNILMTGVDE